MATRKFNNLDIVEDRITGFIGAVTGYCEYLHGSTCYLVTPTCDDDDHKLPQGEWLEESRLLGRPDFRHRSKNPRTVSDLEN